jgi:hypothetical protein
MKLLNDIRSLAAVCAWRPVCVSRPQLQRNEVGDWSFSMLFLFMVLLISSCTQYNEQVGAYNSQQKADEGAAQVANLV